MLQLARSLGRVAVEVRSREVPVAALAMVRRLDRHVLVVAEEIDTTAETVEVLEVLLRFADLRIAYLVLALRLEDDPGGELFGYLAVSHRLHGGH